MHGNTRGRCTHYPQGALAHAGLPVLCTGMPPADLPLLLPCAGTPGAYGSPTGATGPAGALCIIIPVQNANVTDMTEQPESVAQPVAPLRVEDSMLPLLQVPQESSARPDRQACLAQAGDTWNPRCASVWNCGRAGGAACRTMPHLPRLR